MGRIVDHAEHALPGIVESGREEISRRRIEPDFVGPGNLGKCADDRTLATIRSRVQQDRLAGGITAADDQVAAGPERESCRAAARDAECGKTEQATDCAIRPDLGHSARIGAAPECWNRDEEGARGWV